MDLDTSMLNETQRQAMECTEGAVLVLAGAGSGKTRVLTHRVAYLVKNKRVSPYNVLAITFTNKATNEMRERLTMLLGEQNRVWISTFHSLCNSIIRENAEKLGYTSNFTIYDESDSGRIVKKVLAERSLSDIHTKDNIQEHISNAKNKGLSPTEYYDSIKGLVKSDKDIFDVFSRYEELLKLSNAMDFDDLLYNTKKLFNEFPEVLERYANRFKYIHVDEFQDTNAVQFDIVKKLASKHQNLFVVGDDDQSIYGWRGAEVANIVHFDRVYPDVKIFKLLENYRSTAQILTAANNVIVNNKVRHEKELFTNRNGGVKVEYYETLTDYQEADYIIDAIVSLKRLNGYSNKDFAILIRAGHLSRIFESRLQLTRLKYRIMGGFRFFERKEVQDVIAYMRVINNMQDSEAIERIINVPKRGIGDTTVEKLGDYARSHGISLIETILNINQYDIVRGATVKHIEGFRAIIADLMQNKNLSIDKFVEYLVKRVDFEGFYTSTGKEEDIGRWQNIMEFVRYVKEYIYDKPTATIDDFLNTVALQPDNEQGEIDRDVVTIATMHAVKGLEFKVVFIVACEEEVFPASQCIKNDTVEEERRLMYVAITRAMDRLYITNTRSRFRFNHKVDSIQSRFVDESKGKTWCDPRQNQDTYDYMEGRSTFNKFKSGFNNNNGKKPFDYKQMIKNKSAVKNIFDTEKKEKPFEKDITGFVNGAVVVHPTYGEGKIIIVIGKGEDATATVLFESLGVKKFKLALAPLTLKG